MEVIKSAGLYLSSAFIIFGGGLAYIPQTYKIYTRGSAKGFSTLTCMILLIANTVRLFFWYGVRFESQLLAQSIFMFLVMLGVMWVCVRAEGEREERRIWGRGLYKHFWRWTRFIDYLTFTIGLITFLTFLTFLINTDGYYTVLGYVALVTESGMGLPQLLGNWSSKSTQGMSVSMVMMWLFGDIYKTSYFIIRETPIQFLVCGGTQVTLDLMVLLQVAWYRGVIKPEIQI
ncbi:PQ-loop repeat-containing protein 1-like isoform X4 [Oopsacas minuta]|uniref:PQ-loop repeat-containing protein 1-like isoform X4 n=1 Tax=Oopsacas minuta TaxID=111878 RepID=A0AAV7KLS0_9METZ|nr:PQ-loop repeat-containing protein 1-like isoform X4 [Oopsacas minuta]